MSNDHQNKTTKTVHNHVKADKKIPLWRYWTSRYVFTLAIGLMVVAVISAIWIRHTTFENRIDMMEFMADETAKQIVEGNQSTDEDSLLQNFEVRRFLEDPGRYMQIKSNPSIFIVNIEGTVIYSNAPRKNVRHQLNPNLLYSENNLETFYSKVEKDTLYMVKSPIQTDKTIGWVVFFELKGNLTEVNQEYKQLFIMIGALALLGILIIYFLSRRLSKPITDVAAAAEHVKEGHYEFDISEDVREKEVYELIRSFKEMSRKLEKLESLRTELLAGVTHELKTPVTSISGLLQAVKDGVVEGEEAEEFLEISLKESAKMKLMVEDLLAFNSFVANDMPLDRALLDVNETMAEMVHEWEITQHMSEIVELNKLPSDVTVYVDRVRLQQILDNLLNNAMHAVSGNENKKIDINLHTTKETDAIFIEITDNGTGIPDQEQPFIFERFYRGDHKKFSTSGFGLGLPFSRMIAQVLGGDLMLVKSSSKGTTFRLELPKQTGEM